MYMSQVDVLNSKSITSSIRRHVAGEIFDMGVKKLNCETGVSMDMSPQEVND